MCVHESWCRGRRNLCDWQILAYAILRAETEELFEWAFRCFAKIFKEAPLVIFTDGDVNIENAIAQLQLSSFAWDNQAPLWEHTSHCLCVYHLSENFFRHIKPLFGTDVANWKKAIDLFWHIAKESDSHSRATFEDDWQQLVDHVDTIVADSEGKRRQLQWLDEKKKQARKFCARYVWTNCTLGVHSTQRSEAAHSGLKSGISRRMDVSELIEYLEQYNTNSRSKRAVADEVLRLKQAQQNAATALVDFFHDKLVPHAYKLLLQQQNEALMYDAIPSVSEGDDTIAPTAWRVTRRVRRATASQVSVEINLDDDGSINWIRSLAPQDNGLGGDSRARVTTLTDCSCQFPIAFGGLPCRHEQCVHLRNGSGPDEFRALLDRVSFRWIAISEAQEHSLITNLRLKPEPIVHKLFTRVHKRGEREDRFKSLTTHANALVELGVRSDVDFEAATSGLRDLIAHLQNLRMPPSRRGSGAAAATGAQGAGQEGASNDNEQTMTGESATAVVESHKDQMSLKNALNMVYMPCAKPTDNEWTTDGWWRSLVKRRIAWKYENKKRGGWAVGIIIKAGISDEETFHCAHEDITGNSEQEAGAAAADADSSDEDAAADEEPAASDEPAADDDIYDNSVALNEGDVRIHFPEDNTYDDLYLSIDNYTTIATASVRAWMLLETRPLGVAPGTFVRAPPKANRRGRARTTRAVAQHGGPMARKRAKKH